MSQNHSPWTLNWISAHLGAPPSLPTDRTPGAVTGVIPLLIFSNGRGSMFKVTGKETESDKQKVQRSTRVTER